MKNKLMCPTNIFSKKSLREMALALSVLFFAQNVMFLHAAETNIWTDRRKTSQSNSDASNFNPTLMAALPQGPTPSLHFQSPSVSLGSGIEPSAFSHLPSNQAAKNIPSYIVEAITPYANISEVALSNKKGAKTVLLMQDIHLHFEAQSNILNTVDALARALEKKDSRLLVGMEGADVEKADLSELTQIPDRKIIHKVAEGLMKANVLSGVEAAAVGYLGNGEEKAVPLPFDITGVESRDQYWANVKALQDSVPNKSKVKGALEAFNASLVDLKKTHYSEKMTEFDSKWSAYHKNNLDLPDYVAYLDSIETAQTPALQALIEAYLIEGSLDFKQVNVERTKILESLVAKLSETATKELLATSSLYQAGQLTYAGYYGYLKALCQKHGVSLATYPEMNLYIQYVLKSEAIDAAAIFSELEKHENNVLKTLCKTPQESDIALMAKDAVLLSKLADHVLTEDEWFQYEARKKDIANFSARFAALNAAIPEKAKDAEVWWTVLEAFYYSALARNETMSTNMATRLASANTNTALLVAGGFHAKALAKNFSDLNLNVITLSPKITNVEEGGLSSIDVLASGSLPLDRLFTGERLFIPTPSVLMGMGSAVVGVSETLRRQVVNTIKVLVEALKSGKPSTVDDINAQFSPNGQAQVQLSQSILKRILTLFFGLGIISVLMGAGPAQAMSTGEIIVQFLIIFVPLATVFIGVTAFFQFTLPWARAKIKIFSFPILSLPSLLLPSQSLQSVQKISLTVLIVGIVGGVVLGVVPATLAFAPILFIGYVSPKIFDPTIEARVKSSMIPADDSVTDKKLASKSASIVSEKIETPQGQGKAKSSVLKKKAKSAQSSENKPSEKAQKPVAPKAVEKTSVATSNPENQRMTLNLTLTPEKRNFEFQSFYSVFGKAFKNPEFQRRAQVWNAASPETRQPIGKIEVAFDNLQDVVHALAARNAERPDLVRATLGSIVMDNPDDQENWENSIRPALEKIFGIEEKSTFSLDDIFSLGYEVASAVGMEPDNVRHIFLITYLLVHRADADLIAQLKVITASNDSARKDALEAALDAPMPYRFKSRPEALTKVRGTVNLSQALQQLREVKNRVKDVNNNSEESAVAASIANLLNLIATTVNRNLLPIVIPKLHNTALAIATHALKRATRERPGASPEDITRRAEEIARNLLNSETAQNPSVLSTVKAIIGKNNEDLLNAFTKVATTIPSSGLPASGKTALTSDVPNPVEDVSQEGAVSNAEVHNEPTPVETLAKVVAESYFNRPLQNLLAEMILNDPEGGDETTGIGQIRRGLIQAARVVRSFISSDDSDTSSSQGNSGVALSAISVILPALSEFMQGKFFVNRLIESLGFIYAQADSSEDFGLLKAELASMEKNFKIPFRLELWDTSDAMPERVSEAAGEMAFVMPDPLKDGGMLIGLSVSALEKIKDDAGSFQAKAQLQGVNLTIEEAKKLSIQTFIAHEIGHAYGMTHDQLVKLGIARPEQVDQMAASQNWSEEHKANATFYDSAGVVRALQNFLLNNDAGNTKPFSVSDLSSSDEPSSTIRPITFASIRRDQVSNLEGLRRAGPVLASLFARPNVANYTLGIGDNAVSFKGESVSTTGLKKLRKSLHVGNILRAIGMAISKGLIFRRAAVVESEAEIGKPTTGLIHDQTDNLYYFVEGVLKELDAMEGTPSDETKIIRGSLDSKEGITRGLANLLADFEGRSANGEDTDSLKANVKRVQKLLTEKKLIMLFPKENYDLNVMADGSVDVSEAVADIHEQMKQYSINRIVLLSDTRKMVAPGFVSAAITSILYVNAFISIENRIQSEVYATIFA